MSEASLLLVVLVLILLNGYFVAAEFSIVKVRPTRVEQLVLEGSKRAKILQHVMNKIEIHLSAAQLGITLTSLGIGWASEPAIASLVVKAFHSQDMFHVPTSVAHVISATLAFMIATFCHITIGEQVPKMWAIQRSENVALLTAAPLYYFSLVAKPLILILSKSTDGMLKVFGLNKSDEEDSHSEEEIKLILSKSDDIEDEEQEMLERVLTFTDRLVRELMVHRRDMVCVYKDDANEEIVRVVEESIHSRFPVCGEDKDEILGYITLRDLYNNKHGELNVSEILRPITTIYEATPVPKALAILQREKQQMAIVLDEHGGVSGLVTIEDMIEEIVGDIQDEYDNEIPDFEESEYGTIVDASLLVDEINERFGLELASPDGIDTIGGHVLSILEDEPVVGAEFVFGLYKVKIHEVDHHRITLLSFQQKKESL